MNRLALKVLMRSLKLCLILINWCSLGDASIGSFNLTIHGHGRRYCLLLKMNEDWGQKNIITFFALLINKSEMRQK